MQALLHQMTFRFGSEVEVRYAPQAPKIGDYVSHGNALWLVVRMRDDAAGVVVVCEPGS